MRLALALLALAATAVVLRRRRPVTVPQYDDSEIVGMPTTWVGGQQSNMWGPIPERVTVTGWLGDGPDVYVELAPTSRN